MKKHLYYKRNAKPYNNRITFWVVGWLVFLREKSNKIENRITLIEILENCPDHCSFFEKCVNTVFGWWLVGWIFRAGRKCVRTVVIRFCIIRVHFLGDLIPRPAALKNGIKRPNKNSRCKGFRFSRIRGKPLQRSQKIQKFVFCTQTDPLAAWCLCP